MQVPIDEHAVLVIVDVQNDFCPGGALPVSEGDKVVPMLNKYVQKFRDAGAAIIFTRDWHPPDHSSFNSQGGPWPSHCVQNSDGAKFRRDLVVPSEAEIVSKGDKKDEAYSFFQGTDLARELHQRGSPIVLQLTGKVSTINRAFGTRLELYQQGSSLFYSPDSDPAMPQSFGALVTGITGLNNFTVIRPSESPCGQPGWADCPPAVQAGYGLKNLGGNNGAGQTVAIVGMPGDPNIQTAMDTYTAIGYYGLPSTTLDIRLIDGCCTSNDPGWASETAMDVEAVHSVAPGAKIVLLYVEPGHDPMDAVDYVATYKPSGAQIVSNSWSYSCPGFCSDTQLPPITVSAAHDRLAFDTATGLTILFASGDQGAKPDGSILGTQFPASDPNVLAVGATNLVLTGCTILGGSCSYGSETGASISGGGYSGYFAEPSWQTSAIGSKPGRAVPDVSMLGYSPNFWVYSTSSDKCGAGGNSAGWFWCSGTSLSTPLWAGFLAVALQVRGGGNFGNVAPLLYQLAQGSAYATDFHDITTGSNNGFSAGTGWDPVTGLGTPVADKLALALSPVAVSTDKTVYTQGDTVQYTGTGLTGGGSVLACFSTDNAHNLLCVPTSSADDLGHVVGTVQVGGNVPAGPQKFSIQDVSTGRFSNPVQLLILGTPTSISIGLSAGSHNLGSSVTLSGSIAPNPGVVQVTISVSIDAGSTWSILMVIQTNGSGSYSGTWTPPYAGSYSYRASWAGNSQFAGSTSFPDLPWAITGTPAPTIMLLLTAPPTSSRGQSVRLSVTVFNPTGIPIATNATIQVTGPGNYLLFDLVPVKVAALSETTVYYDWTVPNTTGTYTVAVGLLPTGPSTFDIANVVVS